MLDRIVFEEGVKTMPIDLETLSMSSDYDRGNKFPLSHYEFIGEVMNMMEEQGASPELAEMHIAQNGVIYPKEKELSFRSDIKTIHDTRGVQITNLVAKINMTSDKLADKETKQSFALSYNKLGIQVSFGTNVNICSNMTIFGGSHAKNFGTDSVGFDQMMELIDAWTKGADARRARDLRIIDNMKGTRFANVLRETREIIGHFNELLIKDPNSAPLRQGRITEVHRSILKDYDESIENKKDLNLWDIFNCFTLAASHQDVIENRIANSIAIGRYFVERYNLDDKERNEKVVIMAQDDILKEREATVKQIAEYPLTKEEAFEEAEELPTAPPEVIKETPDELPKVKEPVKEKEIPVDAYTEEGNKSIFDQDEEEVSWTD